MQGGQVRSGGPYAAFCELQSNVGASRSQPAGRFALPEHLAQGADAAIHQARRPSSDLARQVLAQNNEWLDAEAKQEAARLERRELMQVVLNGAKEEEDAEAAAEDVLGVLHRALAAAGCPWQAGAQAAAAEAPAAAAPAAAPAAAVTVAQEAASHAAPAPAPAPARRPGTTVSVDFHLPDQRRVVHDFEPSQGTFDVYAKAYELLQDKGRVFSMRLTGPRTAALGPPRLNKVLDEGTWSFSLVGIGLEAGSAYDVEVTQH